MTERDKTSPTQRSLLISHADPCIATLSKILEDIKVSNIEDGTLTQATWIAHIYKKEGHFSVAESLYRRVLKAKTALIGTKHPDTFESMNNLAGVLDSQGDYAAAEKIHREELEICERVLGKQHPHTYEHEQSRWRARQAGRLRNGSEDAPGDATATRESAR